MSLMRTGETRGAFLVAGVLALILIQKPPKELVLRPKVSSRGSDAASFYG